MKGTERRTIRVVYDPSRQTRQQFLEHAPLVVRDILEKDEWSDPDPGCIMTIAVPMDEGGIFQPPSEADWSIGPRPPRNLFGLIGLLVSGVQSALLNLTEGLGQAGAVEAAPGFKLRRRLSYLCPPKFDESVLEPCHADFLARYAALLHEKNYAGARVTRWALRGYLLWYALGGVVRVLVGCVRGFMPTNRAEK
jgi:hypothetical protein